jgi:DNA-binding response OmpR family regulator
MICEPEAKSARARDFRMTDDVNDNSHSEQTRAAPEIRLHAPPPRASCDILLVEDDPSLCRTLRDFLNDCGFVTFAAGGIREAWEMVQSLKPRVCLLDLNLPDGSGLDVLRNILTLELQTRVIVMTAFPLHHLRPRYSDGTLTAWLTKPVPPQQLLEAVREALGENQNDPTRTTEETRMTKPE